LKTKDNKMFYDYYLVPIWALASRRNKCFSLFNPLAAIGLPKAMPIIAFAVLLGRNEVKRDTYKQLWSVSTLHLG